MDSLTFNSLVSFFSGWSLTLFFTKSFSIVFSLLFTVYAVVTYKQIEEMADTIQNPRNRFLVLFAYAQIFVGIFLLLFSILFV